MRKIAQIFVAFSEKLNFNSFSFCRIYLVDHAWTFRPEDARLQLQQYPGLLERMANLFDLSTEDIEKEDLIDQVCSLNFFKLFLELFR